MAIDSPDRPPEREVTDSLGPAGTAPLLVVSRYRFGCWLVIEAQGEVDFATAPLLGGVLDGSSHVIFDLSRVTFIDASGLGVLASTGERLEGAHGSVRVAEPSPLARKLLALTGLDQHVGVYDSIGEALSGHASCW